MFAPTNEAFAALPAGTVDTLLMPDNKAMLAKILTCHVVAGDISSMTLSKWIDKHNGHYTLTTVGGCKLIATKSDGMIMLTDEKGGMATITIADVNQSNGVIHVVNKGPVAGRLICQGGRVGHDRTRLDRPYAGGAQKLDHGHGARRAFRQDVGRRAFAHAEPHDGEQPANGMGRHRFESGAPPSRCGQRRQPEPRQPVVSSGKTPRSKASILPPTK